jgi:chemotaxis protein MotA
MKRIDWTIWLGIFVGLTAILTGAWFEGLSIGFLWHPTAILIVGGGTLGAVIVRRGVSGITGALKAIWNLHFKDNGEDEHKVELARLAWLSRSAQTKGVKAYESYADSSNDVLIAQGLILLADNTDKEKLKHTLTQRLDWEDEEGLQDAATLEAAGGFAPTFGILGAVIGLIGVLRVLDHPELLGVGIASAFVATIYGIGTANLLFFPLAERLRSRHEKIMKRREEIAAVIVALSANERPKAIINQFNLIK